MLYVYTGGRGKTAAALGLALRSVGHGHKVVVIQFKQAGEAGEHKVARRLHPQYEIHQLGEEEGLRFAREVGGRKPNLLILDGVSPAGVEEVVKLVEEIPKEVDVVITAEEAPEELIEKADFVSEMRDVKGKKERRRGVDY